MPRAVRPLVTVALLAGLVAGCASHPDEIDRVCADVSERIAALPPLGPDETGQQVVPALDAQIAVTEQARADLAAISPDGAERPAHDALVAQWGVLATAWRAMRDTRGDPAAGERRVEAAQALASSLRARAEALRMELRAAEAGAQGCRTIPWRGIR